MKASQTLVAGDARLFLGYAEEMKPILLTAKMLLLSKESRLETRDSRQKHSTHEWVLLFSVLCGTHLQRVTSHKGKGEESLLPLPLPLGAAQRVVVMDANAPAARWCCWAPAAKFVESSGV